MKARETFQTSSGKPSGCLLFLLALVFACFLTATATILLAEFVHRCGSNDQVYNLLLKLEKQDARILELEKRLLSLEKKEDFSRQNSIQVTASSSSGSPKETSMPVGPVSSNFMNVLVVVRAY